MVQAIAAARRAAALASSQFGADAGARGASADAPHAAAQTAPQQQQSPSAMSDTPAGKEQYHCAWWREARTTGVRAPQTMHAARQERPWWPG